MYKIVRSRIVGTRSAAKARGSLLLTAGMLPAVAYVSVCTADDSSLESVRFPILTCFWDPTIKTCTDGNLGSGRDEVMEASRRLGFGGEVEAERVGNGKMVSVI
jgi:hypothetical protein